MSADDARALLARAAQAVAKNDIVAAERLARAVLAAAPRHADALHFLGALAARRGDHDDAERHLRASLAIAPDIPATHLNLSLALRRAGKLDAAIAAARQAIALQPGLTEAHHALGLALNAKGDLAEAIGCFRRVIALRPDHAEAHAYLGIGLLMLGELAEAWDEQHWRWRASYFLTPARHGAIASWSGQSLADGSLLLWGEQGVGDEILFAGLAGEAAVRAKHCVLECDPRLVPLFARSFPGIEIVPRANPPAARLSTPDIAAQSPTGDLPRWLRRRFEDFPARRAYLAADPGASAALRARYRALGRGPVIGIAWRSKNPLVGAAKTMALADWAPILMLPGVTFVNLQYGDCAAELAAIAAAHGVRVHHDATIDQMQDLDAFSAQVAAVDLVVSVSNTTVHMAGALGKPAWVLLPTGPGLLSYWFLEREDSPWYPSLRLFRQPAPGDWRSVIARVSEALREWSAP